jgi:hypothetical protein
MLETRTEALSSIFHVGRSEINAVLQNLGYEPNFPLGEVDASRLFIAGATQRRPVDVADFVRQYGSIPLAKVEASVRHHSHVVNEELLGFDREFVPDSVRNLPAGTTFEHTLAALFRSIRTGEFSALQSRLKNDLSALRIEVLIVEPHPLAYVSFYLDRGEFRDWHHAIGYFGDPEAYGIAAQLAGRVGAIHESKVLTPSIVAIGEALGKLAS